MTGSKQPPYRIMSFPDDNGICLTYESVFPQRVAAW